MCTVPMGTLSAVRNLCNRGAIRCFGCSRPVSSVGSSGIHRVIWRVWLFRSVLLSNIGPEESPLR